MKRSLRTWLASLVLLVAPGLAPDLIGQTFRGQPHLAPVALEARCRVADGITDSWFDFGASLKAPMLAPQVTQDANVGVAQAADESVSLPFEPKLNPQSSERLLNDAPESFCPLAFMATLEPVDAQPLEAQPLDTQPTPTKIRKRFVGSAPMVVLLNEEYRPYDYQLQHSFKISLLPIKQPNYCILKPSKTPALLITDYLPTSEQIEFAQRAFRSLASRLPLECYLDQFFYRATGLLDQQGPLATELHPLRLGQRLASGSIAAVDGAVTFVSPVVPVLATTISREPVPAQVGPQVAPNQAVPRLVSTNDFAAAGSALVSAAEGLEWWASTLRTWGQSCNRIAAGPGVPLQR